MLWTGNSSQGLCGRITVCRHALPRTARRRGILQPEYLAAHCSPATAWAESVEQIQHRTLWFKA